MRTPKCAVEYCALVLQTHGERIKLAWPSLRKEAGANAYNDKYNDNEPKNKDAFFHENHYIKYRYCRKSLLTCYYTHMNMLLREEFRIPLTVLALLAAGFFLKWLWLAAIVIGIAKIVWDSFHKIREGELSLDYIAFLAMVVSIFADQYLAGAVVALMITGGESLDAYASARAESALRALVERIPKSCTVRMQDGTVAEKPIRDVREGDVIIVKPNELIPLDGTLRSLEALLNEANLTGEALPVTLARGSFLKSGSINEGGTIEISVVGSFENSTYMRIVNLVQEAKKHQSKVVRLAERVNFPFTAIAVLLAVGAYYFSGELARALAVLVIATPCPLIIAAPVAFIGGLSRAARHNVIIKRPAMLEELARANVIFFDKTGTLTLGEPQLVKVESLKHLSELEIFSVAAAVEFHSIHPLARAISTASAAHKAPMLESTNVVETIGEGIEGDVGGKRYRVNKSPDIHEGLVLSLFENGVEVGRFHFEDVMKENVHELFEALAHRGIKMIILTGDRKENAERLFGKFGVPILAQRSPEEKYAAIDEAKKHGTVVMVGDGLNDAPALAHANVGIVFSGTENSAAIEAAGAVIFDRDIMRVVELVDTSRHAVRVAAQSIWGGVGLSSLGMLFAAFGYIPPVTGALIQEVIDVAVILNSLRASR